MKTVEKQILVALHEEGEMRAAELRDRLQMEQNQQIHYRVNGPLEEYVTTVRREEQPGAAAAARVYGLTDTGREWVEEHSDDVSFTNLAEVEEAVGRLRKEVSDLSDDVDQSVQWYRQTQGHHSEIRGRTDDLEESVESLELAVKDTRGTVDRHDEALTQLRQRDDTQAESISNIGEQIDRHHQQIESLGNRVNDVEQRLAEVEDELSHLVRRVDELEAEPDSLLSRLWPL